MLDVVANFAKFIGYYYDSSVKRSDFRNAGVQRTKCNFWENFAADSLLIQQNLASDSIIDCTLPARTWPRITFGSGELLPR